MKRHYILTFILCAATVAAFAQLPMGSWRMHNAFTEATQIAQSDKLVYAVTDGSLFTVDKEDSEVNYKSKVTGLTGTHISQIAYSETIRRLLIVYNDGKIDLLDDDDEVESIYDLYLSQINYNKSPNSVAIKEGYAYLAMDFGVLVINLKKREIADTYSVLSADDEKKPFISFALTTDSLYAATRDAVYAADFKHNLVDYASWHKKQNIPDNGNITKIGTIADKLYLLQNGKVYEQSSAGWNIISDTLTVTGFSCEADNIYCFTPDLTYRITADSAPVALDVPNPAAAIVFDKFAQTYWLALYGYGVGKYDDRSKTISYVFPSGPCNKNPYRIRCMEDATYIVPGGYFVSGDGKIGELMIYQNGDWNNYGVGFFAKQLDGMVPHDFCDVAVEPNHPEHFFIASYGNGLFEFRDNQLYKWYLPDNSILTSVIPSNPKSYTWVDGLTFDADGNLYMLNVSDAGVKILDRNCNWHAISNEATKDRNRTKDLLISSLNKNIKILASIRYDTGVGVFDDNGTPFDTHDDKAVYHTFFIDQDQKEIHPEYIYNIQQDKEGILWICTNEGVLLVDNPEDLLTSNRCRRIKIARNDGTDLADYLLGQEEVTCITFDGTNRRWIGTANSGLYLLKELDGAQMEIFHHFTTENSPLPSNDIIALNISPRTGEVMIGTAEGFITYQSDAADPTDDYSDVYAYPNPVRPDYEGEVAIMGLTDLSYVKITDAAGNLVAQTRSRGSIAVWDCKDTNGRHVKSGVYLAQILSADGKQHKLTKILVMH